MRASRFARAFAAALLCAALCAARGRVSAQGASGGGGAAAPPSRAGTSALDPAFRLAAGGRALAGPIVDTASSPYAAWLLSEDLALYALTETGKLASRIELSGTGSRPEAFIGLDPFGRILVAQGGLLRAYTRMGREAWSAPLGGGVPEQPAFGPDGRAFVLSGRTLSCYSPSGLRLWQLELQADPSSAPAVDGLGRPCVGLADGRLLLASPYGELIAAPSLGSSPRLLCPLATGAPAAPAPQAAAAGDAAPPVLAAALADGRLLFLGSAGEVDAAARLGAPAASLAWDGSTLYGLDAAGSAFASSASGFILWSTRTGCKEGLLYLFPERLVAAGQGRAVSLSRKGEVFREMSLPGATGRVAVSPAGLAFSAGSDWVLAAYRFEASLGVPSLPDTPAYGPNRDLVERELRFNPLAADADNQMIRLADIEKRLRSGSIGSDESADAAYCAAVATRAFDRELTEIQRRRTGNPLARSQACFLLGELGSPAYRDALFGVLGADADPAVRAAACEALAAIGVDPDGRSMAAFLAAARKPSDERTALVIAEAIEGMALRSGRAPSADGLSALVKLSGASYGRNVRSRAQAALARISGTME